MSLQWVVVGVLIVGIYFFFIKKKPLSAPKQANKKDTKKDGDEMVECKKCGTYTSLDEALISNGNYYCSDECLKA